MVLLKKTYYKTKIIEIEGKIPSISGLAKNAALTAVETKYLRLAYFKKHIITQKILKLKRNLLITIMINILLLQSLWLLVFSI